MSLALANAVSVLAPDGTEIARVVDDALFDNPAGLAFDDRSESLLVVNHALLDPTPTFSVLRALVDEHGQGLIEPSLP